MTVRGLVCRQTSFLLLEERGKSGLFTAVSLGLVRKYCVNGLYAPKIFDEIFDV